MKRITKDQIAQLATSSGYTYNNFNAVVEVESNGNGFNTDGKIIIQFEPSWFKRNKADWLKDTKNITWQSNKVENQTREWIAFNSAFASDPIAAMKSTSIGMPQIMGFHYRLLGFKTVGDMWDFAKVSEYNQLVLMVRFIKANPKLDRALKTGDAATFAYYYNGEQYKKYKYDTRLIAAGM